MRMKKVMKFGIASVAEQRARSLAIAAGTRERGIDEPRVWFPSVSAAARVLSDDNLALLKVIREQRPESMDALARAVNKQAPNVSRSLHTMEQYGLVKLSKIGRTVVPEAMFEHVTLQVA
jgi:predicted transcriptional regulator